MLPFAPPIFLSSAAFATVTTPVLASLADKAHHQ
jgi:hypothetical protein